MGWLRRGESPDTFWLNGPDAGKPVSDRPIRARSYKIDHEAAEMGLGAEQLERLDQVGVLQKRAAYAKALSERAEADVAIAELVRDDRWLLGAQRPIPRRWPMYALLGAQALLLAALLVAMARREPPHPPLPKPPESASEGYGAVFVAPPPEPGRVGH